MDYEGGRDFRQRGRACRAQGRINRHVAGSNLASKNPPRLAGRLALPNMEEGWLLAGQRLDGGQSRIIIGFCCYLFDILRVAHHVMAIDNKYSAGFQPQLLD
jgi:hypothetical protein